MNNQQHLKDRYVTTAALTLLLMVSFHLLVFRPQLERLEQNVEFVSRARGQLVDVRHYSELLTRYRQRLKEMESRIAAREEEFGSESGFSELLSIIERESGYHNLDLKTFRPEGEEHRHYHLCRRIGVEMAGAYAEIIDFKSAVSSLSPPLHVVEFTMSRGAGKREVHLELTVVQYTIPSKGEVEDETSAGDHLPNG